MRRIVRKFPKYRIISEGLYDAQWSEDAKREEKYLKDLKQARFAIGIDDPVAPSQMVKDLNTRMGMVFVMLNAYEIPLPEFMEYLQIFLDVETGIRPKSQPY